MEYKTLTCQEHGGEFRIPRKAGRPPSRCSEAHPCTMVKPPKSTKKATTDVAARTAETRKGKMPTKTKQTRPAKSVQSTKRRPDRQEDAKPATKSRPAASDVTVRHNPSVVLAKRAKDQLEPLDWNLKGRAWIDEDDHAWAEVTGSRGEESIVLLWQDGKFYSQDYSLWDADKTPGQQPLSPKPKSKLPFDPDEMSNAELAKELSGRTVTWWNRLGGSQEHAVIGDKLKIEHAYTGGNETSRQVHFVDKTPNHYAFRTFNVDALMRVK
jgi:hypothetical protein